MSRILALVQLLNNPVAGQAKGLALAAARRRFRSKFHSKLARLFNCFRLLGLYGLTFPSSCHIANYSSPKA